MPLEDRDLASLLDVATAAWQIQRYGLDITRSQFEQDDEKQAAVLYRISIVGEAGKPISPDFRDYDRINLELVWDMVQTTIPELLIANTACREAIEPLLPTEP